MSYQREKQPGAEALTADQYGTDQDASAQHATDGAAADHHVPGPHEARQAARAESERGDFYSNGSFSDGGSEPVPGFAGAADGTDDAE
ncbi:hypothetical protein GCM10027591_15240 [Zhihengliuella somnathii]